MPITKSGKDLENRIEELLKTQLSISSFDHSYLQYVEHFPCLIKNIPYVSIFDKFSERKPKSNTEFGIYSSKETCLIRIECKYQEVAGSISEKYLGLYIQATCWEEQNIFFYCDGAELKNPSNKYMKGFRALIENAACVSDIKPHTKNMQLFIADDTKFIQTIKAILEKNV